MAEARRGSKRRGDGLAGHRGYSAYQEAPGSRMSFRGVHDEMIPTLDLVFIKGNVHSLSTFFLETTVVLKLWS